MYSASIRGACGFRSGTQSAFSPVQPRTRVNSLKFGSAVTGGSWPRTAGAPEMSSKPVTDQPDCNDDEQDPSAAPPSRMLAGCLQSMGYTYVCDTQATRRCQSPSPPSPSHPPSRMLTGCLQAQGYTACATSRQPHSPGRPPRSVRLMPCGKWASPRRHWMTRITSFFTRKPACKTA